jgi:hypothetical protein
MTPALAVLLIVLVSFVGFALLMQFAVWRHEDKEYGDPIRRPDDFWGGRR